jgi:glyoxylase-like metal-dependent hydrolase (beta-lactamase superfamily II)
MAKRLLMLFTVLGLVVEAPAAQDTRSVLLAAARNMGADTLKCITYSGTGYVGIVGQNFSPLEDWARVELASFTRSIDFDARSSREEQVRRQGTFPRRGGGGIPIEGEQRQILLVRDKYAWNMQGTTVNPAPAAAEQRQLEIWLTPHGFLKGAMAASDAIALSRFEAGQRVNMVSFMVGKYRVNGSINEENLVTRVQTFIATPFLGDTLYEQIYSRYKDFGGVKFPTDVHFHTNWDNEARKQNANSGHHSFQLNVSSVQPNACGDALTIPDAVQKATVPSIRVESQKLVDGVYYLTGGSHHSVAVEFRDFVALVEAPLNEQRSIAVIQEVKRLFPDKRLRYLVNTHHHFDHSGGLRTYVHEGVTIITHRTNEAFYEQHVLSLAPRTVEPDRLSLYPPDETAELYYFETVDNDKYTLSDGTRNVDLYYVQGNPHTEGMLMAYLPKEGILIEADLFNPPAPNAPPPTTPSAASMSLFNTVQRLKLGVTRIVPLHGREVPWTDFLKIVGKSQSSSQ